MRKLNQGQTYYYKVDQCQHEIIITIIIIIIITIISINNFNP